MKSRTQKSRRSLRRGATMVEAAIITVLLFTLLLGTIDLGIAVLRYNMLATAARTGARMAIVHGADAPTELVEWNSTTAATEITTALGPLFSASGIDSGDFTVTVTYEQLGGADDTRPGRPVTVEIAHDWVPIVGFIFGNQGVPLTANSRMIISN